MIRLLADENFNGSIVRSVRARVSNLDLVRVQDTEIAGTLDPYMLAWAAEHGRVLLSHDYDTIPGYAYDRLAHGLPMAGVILVKDTIPVSVAADGLVLIVECSTQDEWVGRVEHITGYL